MTPFDQLQRTAEHIKNKYYDTKYQGSLVENAKNADEYAQYLWNAAKMECYSANTLLVMMARQLGFEARLACGFNSKTVHENKGYITSNDGHARAEVKLNGKWIIMDVTPVHQENEMQDLQDQEIKKDPFGAKLTPSQLQALKEQQLKNSKDLSRETQQLLKQGVALPTALKFQQFIEKTKKKSEYIADELIKMLQDTYEIQTSKTIHTIKATSQIDLTKLLRTVPGIFNDNPEEKIHDLNQLKKTPLYKKEIQESHEITKLPDELRTHLMIDVS